MILNMKLSTELKELSSNREKEKLHFAVRNALCKHTNIIYIKKCCILKQIALLFEDVFLVSSKKRTKQK